MADKLRRLLAFVYSEFAPLLVFLAAEHFFALRAAIAITVAFSVADVVWRRYRGLEITRLYQFFLISTVGFGLVDLLAPSPFLFRYESVATNLITAGFFVGTILKGDPILRELAEKTLSEEKKGRPDVGDYLRALTGVWAVYFVLKAALYGWVSYTRSLHEAMAFRSAFGPVSLGVMIFGERALRPRLYRLARAAGVVRLS